MTRIEACRALGISSSASISKAELLYQKKCKEFQLHMVPGMPQATRQKAQANLVRLTSAWETLQKSPSSTPQVPRQGH